MCTPRKAGALLRGERDAPIVDRRLAPIARRPHPLAQRGGFCRVYRERHTLQHDAVILSCRAAADKFVEHIPEHQRRVTLQRVAPAAAAGDLMTEQIAL